MKVCEDCDGGGIIYGDTDDPVDCPRCEGRGDVPHDPVGDPYDVPYDHPVIQRDDEIPDGLLSPYGSSNGAAR